MATSASKKTAKRGKYEEPLAVQATFLDIMKASVKNAEETSKKKRKKKV